MKLGQGEQPHITNEDNELQRGTMSRSRFHVVKKWQCRHSNPGPLDGKAWVLFPLRESPWAGTSPPLCSTILDPLYYQGFDHDLRMCPVLDPVASPGPSPICVSPCYPESTLLWPFYAPLHVWEAKHTVASLFARLVWVWGWGWRTMAPLVRMRTSSTGLGFLRGHLGPRPQL